MLNQNGIYRIKYSEVY